MTSSLGTAAFPIDTADVARQLLQAERCALVVVDIQEKLLPPIFNKDELIRNSQLLIRLANVLKLPTLVTTQYSKGLGATVPDIASLLGTAKPIDKLGQILRGCGDSPASRRGSRGLGEPRPGHEGGPAFRDHIP